MNFYSISYLRMNWGANHEIEATNDGKKDCAISGPDQEFLPESGATKGQLSLASSRQLRLEPAQDRLGKGI
jgi:hypothetical protein